MKLPNFEQAFIDDDKFVEYCLNPEHEEGKHKSLVFEKKLGITQGIYFVLKNAILEAIQTENAVFQRETSYGILYRLDFEMAYLDKKAWVRTGWIFRPNENFPRLTTCFIISKN